MAWNQPGGQNQNPWGKRPSQGNDFDKAFKDWQKRFESMFGGRRGGGEGGERAGGSGSPGIPFTYVAGIALALWAASGFYQVEAPEIGVVQRFGKYVGSQPPGWGWHIPWPVEKVTMVNVSNINSSEYKSRVLTADVNLVEMQFAVQYQLVNPEKYLFGVRNPEDTLREVSESAIREVVGRSELQPILVSNRQQITERSRELIQRTMDQYGTGIRVTSVNLTDVQVPEPVAPSQRDANKAIADKERMTKEAEAYAAGILPAAEGAASRQIQEAEAYRAQVVALAEGEAGRFTQIAQQYARAPAVTRERLYIETVEGVLNRSRKVIIDQPRGGGGNNNVMLLPLDRLMDRGSRESQDGVVTVRPESEPEPSTPAPDPRQRGQR
ncbi:MAG TPA: FtsH protease activity modulator HflK [Steroidobacteraceae bacterium]|nr:FtsH protease activity modulator HflK [Steroidobacteraceae bacterium]HRX88612.1 FtsH protease activity modulator HflK [Steroidobacteraceae bacterium]